MASAARRSVVRWGSVGAGTGARAGGLQGGVGTASRHVALGDTTVVVGAIAVVNAVGSPCDPTTGLLWEPAGFGLRRPNATMRRAIADAATTPAASLNTTIGVVATSARLDKAEASKLAAVAHDGLARAIRPAHGLTDGDTVFALATGDAELSTKPAERIVALNRLLAAGADAFAAACTHAVVSAATLGAAPAWADLTAP